MRIESKKNLTIQINLPVEEVMKCNLNILSPINLHL